MTDFSQVTVRCSSLGKLMTEPKSASDKAAGNLSETAKTELIRTYSDFKYGRYVDIKSKYTEKGKAVEETSITMVSVILDCEFEKNTERKTDGWISGEIDCVGNVGGIRTVVDTKSSWDMVTFLSAISGSLNSDYVAQMKGYCQLWETQQAIVAYCLTSCPQHLLEAEKYKLLKSMNVISEESPEYQLAALSLEHNLTFDEIPLEERVFLFYVQRDDEWMQRVRGKVEKGRDWLRDFEKRHLAGKAYAV